MKRSAPADILLVEDSPVDSYAVKRIVADYGPDLHLWVIPDGVDALLFLRQAPPFTHVPAPALILLDLHLPPLDGALLLPQVRQLPGHQATPIIIFSGTPEERAGARCCQLGATAYVQKSTDFAGFREKVTALLQRWLPEEGERLFPAASYAAGDGRIVAPRNTSARAGISRPRQRIDERCDTASRAGRRSPVPPSLPKENNQAHQ